MPAFFFQCFWKLLKASEVGVQGQSSGLWFRKITSAVVEKEDGCGGTCELRRGMQKWQAQRAKQPFSWHAGGEATQIPGSQREKAMARVTTSSTGDDSRVCLKG